MQETVVECCLNAQFSFSAPPDIGNLESERRPDIVLFYAIKTIS